MMTNRELKEAREIIESVCQETDLVCEIQESAKKLLAHISEQAEQIATLKAAFQKERALAIQNNPNRTYEWTYEAAEIRAKDQLAHTYPEIFQEE